MGFKAGMPRPANAGRKPGSRNKKTIVKASVILAEREINPTDEILKLIPQLNPKDQVATWQYLHSYLESKPKQIELNDNESEFDEQEAAEIPYDNLIKLARS